MGKHDKHADKSRPNDADDQPNGSGRGGPLGTPSHDTVEAPPALEQEKNDVVSGGGVVQPSEEDSPQS